MSHLTHLRLSHNSFVGAIPIHIENLTKLELLHLQNNRVQGSITLTGLQQGYYDESAFITDCGSPANFDPVDCKGCSMCCKFLCVFPSSVLVLLPHICLYFVLFFIGNKDGDCQPDVKPLLLQVQSRWFQNYSSFCFVILAIVVGTSCILCLTSYAVNVNKDRLRQALSTWNISTRFLSRAEKTHSDEEYALKHVGEGSVYSFFLGDSVVGWLVALVTTAAQVFMVSHCALFHDSTSMFA